MTFALLQKLGNINYKSSHHATLVKCFQEFAELIHPLPQRTNQNMYLLTDAAVWRAEDNH